MDLLQLTVARIEYADQVLFPMLHTKLGIGPISMKLNQRGWSTGRVDVGSVTFEFTPLAHGHTLPTFSFVNRGDLIRIHASIFAHSAEMRSLIQDVVIEKVQKHFPDVEVVFPIIEDSKHVSRLYLLLVAETSNGFRLGRDWLYADKMKEPMLSKIIKTLFVNKVVTDLSMELAHGGCVDEFLQDQLVVFQALADGRSKVEGGTPSLHTHTARWVAEEILGVEFKNERCVGIGFVAGNTHWSTAPVARADAVTDKLSELKLHDSSEM